MTNLCPPNTVPASSRQVDGNHYTDMKLQPLELAFKLGGTPSFCKVAKYTTRNKGDKEIQLMKAIHCLDLEAEYAEYAFENYKYVLENTHLIYEFTSNFHIQNALLSMVSFNYTSARESLMELLDEYYETKEKENNSV